jgi:hypothetical protein
VREFHQHIDGIPKSVQGESWMISTLSPIHQVSLRAVQFGNNQDLTLNAIHTELQGLQTAEHTLPSQHPNPQGAVTTVLQSLIKAKSKLHQELSNSGKKGGWGGFFKKILPQNTPKVAAAMLIGSDETNKTTFVEKLASATGRKIIWVPADKPKSDFTALPTESNGANYVAETNTKSFVEQVKEAAQVAEASGTARPILFLTNVDKAILSNQLQIKQILTTGELKPQSSSQSVSMKGMDILMTMSRTAKQLAGNQVIRQQLLDAFPAQATIEF